MEFRRNAGVVDSGPPDATTTPEKQPKQDAVQVVVFDESTRASPNGPPTYDSTRRTLKVSTCCIAKPFFFFFLSHKRTESPYSIDWDWRYVPWFSCISSFQMNHVQGLSELLCSWQLAKA